MNSGQALPRLGDTVLVYQDFEWYDQGTVCKIDGTEVHVDFFDWIQCWPLAALTPCHDPFHPGCFMSTEPGERVTDYGRKQETRY